MSIESRNAWEKGEVEGDWKPYQIGQKKRDEEKNEMVSVWENKGKLLLQVETDSGTWQYTEWVPKCNVSEHWKWGFFVLFSHQIKYQKPHSGFLFLFFFFSLFILYLFIYFSFSYLFWLLRYSGGVWVRKVSPPTESLCF